MRATFSVLKPGARHVFYVITTTEGLTHTDRARLAQRDGNEYVESAVGYDLLMSESGFVDIELVDVTPQYLETAKSWKMAWEEDAESFVALLGEEDYRTRMRNRSLDIAHAEDGLVKRYLVSGVKP